MNIFIKLDYRLEVLASKLNAKLSKDRPGLPELLRTFQERRIDWLDGDIRKAIIIQPKFTMQGVDSALWSFVNIAWIYDAEAPSYKRHWKSKLFEDLPFEVVEQNFDNLLEQSVKNLSKVTRADLL